MEDCLYRGVIQDAGIRFVYGVATRVANTATLAHNCDPVSAHILGRALGAAVLASPLLNEDEKYTVQWRYNGALEQVTVDVDGTSKVRGYAVPVHLMGQTENLSTLYGENGTINVIKSCEGKQLNNGTIKAALFDVVDDLSFFFSVSDQVETAMTVMIGFNPDQESPVRLCQGILLQALPDCDYERLEAVRKLLEGESCRELLMADPRVDNHFELILKELFGEGNYSLSACPKPEYFCGCTREKVGELLKTLPEEERRDAREKGETIKVNCRFCNQKYEF